MIKQLEDIGYSVKHHWSTFVSEEDAENGVEPDETIVRVAGHGVDTTIYTHDEESIRDLLSHVETPHPRYTPYEEQIA